ncbi:MBL fold metallo-hydrolase [Fredinandcohnia humi]
MISLLNIGSLILGLIAWILPFVNIMLYKKQDHRKWVGLSIMSIGACAFSLYFQIVYGNYLVKGDEEAISLSMAKKAAFYPMDYFYEPVSVDRIVKEGDIVTIGNHTLEVVETPGHSKDHISFIMDTPERSYLFGGDLIFYEGKVATQFIPDCNVFEIGTSLRKLEERKIDVLLPGHETFVLNHAQDHIKRAIESIERMVIPQSIIY